MIISDLLLSVFYKRVTECGYDYEHWSVNALTQDTLY